MKILCGYNVNIDSVYSISGTEVSNLLSSQDISEITAKIKSPPNVVNSISDFVTGLVLCMQSGTGAEWLIHEKSVFDILKNLFFDRSIIRMGGNAGIMANVMSEMGADLVVPNVVMPSMTQVSLFSKKSIMLPHSEKTISECTDELVHFVFDFKKGETFLLDGTTVTVPRENRLIATYDSANIELAVNPDFEAYALNHISEIDGVLLSGFHMLVDTYPDGSTYVEKLNRAVEQIKSWRRLNSSLKIHAELGHFLNRDIAYSVFSQLAQHVDCIGMNEDELTMLYKVHDVSANNILQMHACSIIDATILCALEFGVKRMKIHTREFVLSVCAANLADPSLELEAMGFGVKCAATFAATGKLNSRKFVEEEASTLDESVFGKGQVHETLEYIGKKSDSGMVSEYMEYVICILPTILCDNPIATVGLGDTFSSATFLRELELHKMHV
ncbi:MAG: ADP-dependent glucokinase/phosphofructokinase [Methanosarcinaceae archaeon]|nr:ADP-dependent glucokinase/phosphofructokinase [Methanosarcinaceae archaeon]